MAQAGEGRAIEQDRLEELLERVTADTGAVITVPLALLGHQLGLFTALVGEPITSDQLATRTGLAERYVREWLLAMAASGYLTYAGGGSGDEPKRSARYHLSPEQSEIFTNAESAANVVPLFHNLAALLHGVDQLENAFRTGQGIGWHELHDDVFDTTDGIFAPQYRANLTGSWIPALTGVADRLVRGGRVADVGCGFATSTIVMAKAYPNSTFTALDLHEPSIATARKRAAEAGVADRITFRTAGAAELAGSYDLITFFDCLHDMPDPITALRAARSALAPGGRVMLVELRSWDTVEESLDDPATRRRAGASLLVCLPSGLSGPPAAGLGNQAGPSRTLRLAEEAGFRDGRVAASTENNLIYELAP